MVDRRCSLDNIAKVHEWKAKCYLCWRDAKKKYGHFLFKANISRTDQIAQFWFFSKEEERWVLSFFLWGRALVRGLPSFLICTGSCLIFWPELSDATDFTTIYYDHIVSNWQYLDLYTVSWKMNMAHDKAYRITSSMSLGQNQQQWRDKDILFWDFPGSPVVKTAFQCSRCGFNPWLGI